VLYDIVGEPVGEDLSWERGNGHTGGLPLEDVSEVFEVRVSAAYRGGF